jgi:hypothetical protein
MPPPDDTDADLTRGGAPLPLALRQFYEPRFGRSFSAVRVHTGVEAERRTEAVHALAFTYGNHVWLGRGQALGAGHVLAHELAHVVQQRQPPALVGTSGAPLSTAGSPVLQRILPYWEPASWGGDQAHDEVLTGMGKVNKVFTEAPVPNANARGADQDRYGFADFYGADTTVGVYWKGHNHPLQLPAGVFGKKIKKSGRVYTGYPSKAAPQLDDATVGDISRADKAPKNVMLGDLKPWYSIGAASGPGQLDNYEAGFKLARQHFNDYQSGFPSRVKPAGTQWDTLHVGRFVDGAAADKNALEVPKKFKFGESTAKSHDLIVKKVGVPIFRPAKKVKGRLFVAKDPGFVGIWSYFWFPNKPVKATDLTGLDELGRSIQRDEIDYLRQAPLKKSKLSKPGVPRASGKRLQRKAKDPFVHDTFKNAVKANTDKFKALKKSSEFPDFETMVHAVEVQNAMSGKVGAVLPTVPVSAKTAARRYGKADLWTGPSASTIGLMRKVFGGTFVKVMDFYQNAKEKLSNRLKERPEPGKGFGGGMAGAAVKVAFKLLKLIGGIVVQRTLTVLSQSLVQGVTDKLKSLFNPEELLEQFLDPEKREAFDNKVAEFKKLREDLETKAVDSAEDMLERVFGPYDALIEKVDTVRKIVSGITRIISLVRWGARAIACLSPPAWGCLWILAEAVLEKFASLVIQTCWFQKKVTPLVVGVGFIKDLPKTLAGFIITQLKQHVLPDQVHDLLPDPASITTPEVRPEDVPCEEGGDGAHRLTPERKRLMEMQEKLGEEKFKAFMRLVMKAGIPSDRPLTIADIEKLEEMLLQTETNDLKRLAHSYQKPKNGVLVDMYTYLERAKGKAEPAAPEDKVPEALGDAGDAAPEADAREAAKDGQGDDTAAEAGGGAPVRVVDGDKARLDKAPEPTGELKDVAGLVLNPRWSHQWSESTVYKVDVRYYDESFDGPALFIVRNVEVKVGKGAREWWPSEDNRKALRIIYTVQHDYKLDPDKEEYLHSKGTRVYGLVDKDAG